MPKISDTPFDQRSLIRDRQGRIYLLAKSI